jgi:hypothetical protein
MIARVREWIIWLWNTHIQKVLGYLSSGLIGLDLVGYAEPIKGLIGAKPYYGIVLVAALLISIRAHKVTTPA